MINNLPNLLSIMALCILSLHLIFCKTKQVACFVYLTLALLFYVYYLLTGKPWYYHLLPSFILVSLALFDTLMHFSCNTPPTRSTEQWVQPFYALLLIAIFLCSAIIQNTVFITASGFRAYFERSLHIDAATLRGKRLLSLDTNLAVWPRMATNVPFTLVNRLPYLWMLPAQIISGGTKILPATRRMVQVIHLNLIEDKPDFVFVRQTMSVGIGGVEHTAPVAKTLLALPTLQRDFKSYQLIRESDVYRLYARR